MAQTIFVLTHGSGNPLGAFAHRSDAECVLASVPESDRWQYRISTMTVHPVTIEAAFGDLQAALLRAARVMAVALGVPRFVAWLMTKLKRGGTR